MSITELKLSVRVPEDIQSRCELSSRLVDAGDYEGACEALGAYWRGVGLRPDVRGLSVEDAASVLLQVGVLTSIVGEQHGSEVAPMLARALIGEGKVLFETINSPRAIEAESELGGAYIRAKDYETATGQLGLVLRKIGDEPSELRATTVCRLATALLGKSAVATALRLLADSALAFELAAAPHQRGKYHKILATSYTLRGEQSGDEADFDRALLEYEAACFHFENCGNKTHLAITTNNRAELFLRLKMLSEAEEHLMKARRLFVELNRPAYIEEVDRSLATIRPPVQSGNLPDNVIRFRAARMATEPHIVTVPDAGLVDLDIFPGDRLELKPADEFVDGDAVLIEAEGKKLLGRAYHVPGGGIRLQWAFDIMPARSYQKHEYKLLGVL